MKKTRNLLILIAVISAAFLVLMAKRSAQGISDDAALQSKALQQYLEGKSPSFNHIVTARPDNLAKNNVTWLSEAPPSTQLLIYPLIKNGVTLGIVLRIIVIICIFIGTVGWVRWFSLFRLPIWVKIAFAILLPWMRYSSDTFFTYIADSLSYAAAPWIFLATFKLGEIWESKEYSFFKRPAFSALFGFCLGCAYLFKYSLVFISSGAVIYLGLKAFRKINTDLKQRITNFMSVAIFFIVPIVYLSLLNYKLSGQMNIATIGAGRLQPQDFLYALSNPALAVAGAEHFFRYVLFHPTHVLTEHHVWRGILGVPGGLLFWWILWRSRTRIRKGYELLAVISFFVSWIVIFILWGLTNNISYQTRHIAAGSIAILPFLIENSFDLWRTARRLLRIILLGAGIIYIALPLLSGVPSVRIKALRAINYKAGPSGIYNPCVTFNDMAGIRDRLMKDFSPENDIWYLAGPATPLLDLPGRMIMNYAEYKDADTLRRTKYMGGSGLRIHALLPPEFEKDKRGEAIRNSFEKAGEWKKEEIEGCNPILWKTVLKK